MPTRNISMVHVGKVAAREGQYPECLLVQGCLLVMPGWVPEGSPEQPCPWLVQECAESSHMGESPCMTSQASSLPVQTQASATLYCSLQLE